MPYTFDVAAGIQQTYSFVISGPDSVRKTGLGILAFTGENTYSGGTTILGGTLQIGNYGTTGSIVGNVTNNAELAFYRSNDLSFAGIVSGTGSLKKQGAGKLTLTGNSTYTGGTNISAGTLQLGNGGTTGTIVGNISNLGALAFNRSDNLSFDGVISGMGSLTKLGSNTLTLTGANSYAGVTTISGGTLQIGNGGTAGTIVGNVANAGALVFNRSDSSTFVGAISGNGSLTKLGAGTLTLTGANTHTGGTMLTSGTLQIGNGGTTGSIAGTVANAGTLVFNRSDSSTFDGAISGNGSLTKLGTGTLTLTGNSTYTGGTAVSGGGLQIGAGGTTGSIVGNVTNNSNLAFNRSDNTSFSGVISGSGSLWNSGAGTLTLTGANTYAGGTTVSSGTLQIGNGGTTGSIVGNVTNDAALTFNRSDIITFAGAISGSGNLTKTGTGVLTLTGNNTYSGGTTISSGKLTLGNGATAGYITGNVTNNATLNFQTTSNTFDGVISGSGNVWKYGAGTLTLTNANTYNGGTTIGQGVLMIGAGGTTGSIVGDVINSSTLVFNRSDNITFAGAISGSGSLTKAGSNTLTLTGANTYAGVTTIQGGTLQIGNGGTAGAIAGNVANAGALAFNRSDSSTFAGAISGNGSLTKLGAGTLTLTGANTHTGGTTLSGGTLEVGNGGTTGSIAGPVANAGALVFNRSDSSSFAGAISGGGSLTKLGAGTLILNGANTYTGGTTISGGTLEVALYGSVKGNIVNNGVLAFNAQNTYATAIVDGVISGSGSLLKSGGGTGTHTVVLTGANTYTGGTTISAGVLSIGNGGTTGSIVGNVVNNGSLVFNRSDDTSFAGLISGSGGVTKSGAGTLTVTGNNTYTGTTQISGGALQIGNGGTTGWVAGNFSGGTVIFNRSDDIATNKNIGSTLIKQGAGTLTYTGQKFGNVVVSNGTFQIGDGGTLGEVSANITNNAAVVFNRSNNTLFGAYTMSGSGSMTKLGAGTLTLTGNNTYTGGTTISAGTLQIGQGYAYGSIVGDITNHAALVFNRSDNTSFAGVIGGSGSLTKLGNNTLTLTGANTYSGGTTIAGGTLAFASAGNSSLAGDVGGSGGLGKSGAGMLTLTGVNTYTGGTGVEAGTLQLDGSLNGTSGVSLAQGATLATDDLASITLGVPSARMDVAGVLTPGGAGAGLLNLALGAGGKLGFATGSILSFDLGATPDLIAFDQVGDWLDGSGNATLQLNAAMSDVDYGKTYTVFHNTSTQNFTLAGIAGYDSANYTANFFQSGNDYNVSFTAATPVPEADTYALMLVGIGLLGLLTRRRERFDARLR